MKIYFVCYPQNMANDFLIYAAENKAGRALARQMEAEAGMQPDGSFRDFHRISRREAERYARRHDNFFRDTYNEYILLDALAVLDEFAVPEQYTRHFW